MGKGTYQAHNTLACQMVVQLYRFLLTPKSLAIFFLSLEKDTPYVQLSNKNNILNTSFIE
jgi:hypothetical protein